MTRYDLEGGKLVPDEHGEWVSYFAMQGQLEHLREALSLADIEMCALLAPPFDDKSWTDWPKTLNDADRECLAKAHSLIREALRT